MRKLTGFLAFMGLIMLAVQAQAVTLGIYEKGALVPSVYHNGSTVDTVVGILCEFNCTDHVTASGTVYWTFFAANSTHVTDGSFTCTDDDLYGFSWKANSGRGLNDKDGYLVFLADPGDANMTISANAFLVDTAKKDAIFIPVVPLVCNDFVDKNGVRGCDSRDFDPRAMTEDSLDRVLYGIRANTTVDMRYWIDPTYNAATTVVVWLTKPANAQTVLVYNDEEESKSVNINMPLELNKIIPCQIPGMPLDYIDGFIQWTFPASTDGMAYSYISSTLFGAQQTLLAAECDGTAPTSQSQPGCGCAGAGY